MSTCVTKPITVQPRRAVLEMPEYHPPLAGRDALRLDFNENTFAPSPLVLDRLKQITAEGLTNYPEREPAERKVAAHFGLDPAQVLLTNGVDEAIHLICCAFLEQEDEALDRHSVVLHVRRQRRHDDTRSGQGAGRRDAAVPLRALPRCHQRAHEAHHRRLSQQSNGSRSSAAPSCWPSPTPRPTQC